MNNVIKVFLNIRLPQYLSQMLSLSFCGSFHSEEDHDEAAAVPASTPRRTSGRRLSFCRTAHDSSKNPYSARGLDKFEALLADLEEKRKKIYTGNDPDNISFVRFIFTGSNDCVPIVVKPKDKNHNSQPRSHPIREEGEEETTSDDPKNPNQQADTSVKQPEADGQSKPQSCSKKKGLLSSSLDRFQRPSNYFPAAIILILVLLAFFGRSVAILCMSIGWYLLSSLKPTKPKKEKKKEKKKELSTRSSQNKITVNTRHHAGW
ncbi:hypothetical protein SAY87_002849 [Trapa incisa]|uniref:ZCF37 n=1 Tax=Trapa incisa TaxID=236973 RepID=A0AAN7KN29_9MYRT|nr:hypothetical protein SAY87_002849 [Trapa incisa]